jgi:hypothetical protein
VHVHLCVPELACEALQGQRVDPLEQLLPQKLVGLLRRDHPELALWHSIKERTKLGQVVVVQKPRDDGLLNCHLPVEQGQRPDIVIGDRATDVSRTKIRHAQDKKYVRKLLLFLTTERAVDLVCREGETVVWIQPDVPTSFTEKASMELDVEAADRVVAPVQEPIVGVGPRRAMVLDSQDAAAGDLIDQLLEPPFGEDAEKHLGDSAAALHESLADRPVRIWSETSEAFGTDSIDEDLNTTPLELEVGCYGVKGLPMQHLRYGENLTDFPRLGERCTGEDVCKRVGQLLEVPQRGRGSMEVGLPPLILNPRAVGHKERREPELRSFEILLDKFNSDPTATEALGSLARDV